MMRLCVLTTALLLVEFPRLAAGQATRSDSSSAPPKAYRCVLYLREGARDIRYSSSAIRTNAIAATLNDAWKEHILATYHITDPHTRGGCQILGGSPASQGTAVNSSEAQWTKLGAEVIHVDWTSAPGQVLAATAPPPSPAHLATAPPPSAPPRAATPAATPPKIPAPAASPVPVENWDAGSLQEPFRARALQEAAYSKSTCLQHPQWSVLFDCDCFARIILAYRVAHASEYREVPSASHDTGGWEPLSNLLYGEHLPCTACTSDVRLAAYATNASHQSLANVIAQKGASHPSVTNTVRCTVETFTAAFKTQPYATAVDRAFNPATAACWKKYANY